MDWSNEKFVKLYQRVTDDDMILSWEARALWHEMLKRFDPSGLMTTKRGAQGLALQVGMPLDVVERVLPELETDGRIRRVHNGWCAPNFLHAQEARKNDRLRQQELREKRRIAALNGSASYSDVTNRDESSRDVTASHSESRNVQPRHSPDQTRSDQTRQDETCARARAIHVVPEGVRLEPLSFNPKRFKRFVDDTFTGLVEIAADGTLVDVARETTADA